MKFPLAPGVGGSAPGVCLNRQTISNKVFKNRHYLCNYEMSCNGIVANFTLSDRGVWRKGWCRVSQNFQAPLHLEGRVWGAGEEQAGRWGGLTAREGEEVVLFRSVL